MENIKQCVIEGCFNEVKFTTKLNGKIYYSCKKHEKDVAQIVAAEHTKEEIERANKQRLFNLSKEDNPEWIRV